MAVFFCYVAVPILVPAAKESSEGVIVAFTTLKLAEYSFTTFVLDASVDLMITFPVPADVLFDVTIVTKAFEASVFV